MTPVDQDALRQLHGYHSLAVAEVVEETADTRSYVLDVPAELEQLFRYRPGQFCTIRVRIGDDEHLRSYSMSSAPETDARLTLTVKRVPGGIVSNWLADHVAVGDTLEMTKPAGVFCVRDADAAEAGRPIVGFCGGSGVTPVISIAKSVLAAGDRPVRLLLANRDRDAVIFGDQLAELEARHADRLVVHHHLDDAGGYLGPAAVAEFLGETRDADFFICGPTPFMDLIETSLLDAGVTAEHISIERFVNAHEIQGPPPGGDSADTGGADTVPAEVTVILKGKRHTVTYQRGDTLLETARRGGLQAPFSCEAGNCATCMGVLHDGTVTMRVNNALDDDEVAEGLILTCQSLPTSSTLTVEYENF